ncbi:MAG: ATP-binding protein, partial [Alphaproteobacteria bacterium]
VEGYGGSIDKHMGDNVMAVFGAPVAHSDDPERALRAALDIHRAMAELTGEFGRDLRAHIGIASGQVVASGTGSDAHREYTVTGSSVNLASRLQDKARAGETLISQAVHRAVTDVVESTPMGEIEVKGIVEPVPVWRLAGLRGDVAAARHGPFVGRRAERRQFSALIEECLETGNGQTILARGEAGIGKTRLVEEFTALARAQGFACHKGLVLDFGVGKGQDAVRALVRSLLGLAGGGNKAARAAAADRAVEAGWLEAGARVFLNDLLDLPQPLELHALYDAMDNATRNGGKRAAVANLVRGASAAQPILVTVEDVHWADGLTLAQLARIASMVADCPAILVMTSRVEGDPLDQTWRASLRGSPLTTMDLQLLRAAEAEELAGGFVETDSTFVRECIARAEGNPLFLEQLLRNAEEGAPNEVPGSIQSLVLARMDRLEPRDKLALQAASVLGQRFASDALSSLLEDTAYDCKALVEHDLARIEGDGYLFAHALIQEGVYSSLLQARKRALHRRAADWFADHDPTLYAEHLDRADDPKAPKAYLEAAESQEERYHFERAQQLIVRGLELAQDGATKFALMKFSGELFLNAGQGQAAVEVFRAAFDSAVNEIQTCQALIGLASGMRLTDELDEALRVLDRAEGPTKSKGLNLELARLHHLRGNLYFPLGNIDGCREEHELALEFAQKADSPEWEAQALGGLGDAEYARASMDLAAYTRQTCV